MKSTENFKRLAASIGDSNSAAFREFYSLFVNTVFRFSGYYVKLAENKQEIVSNVFCSVWSNRKSLWQVENIEAYLFTLTKNHSLNFLKKQSREPEYRRELPLTLSSEGESPEDIFITAEFNNFLQQQIAQLPEKCRMVFLLSREEGLKYKDIAKILDISEKTVNAHMVSALKKIHESVCSYLNKK
ncbi:MAG: RNA polymerase sigma-70 factor [Bacteroidales bacterium]|nr:RNA polymerase sigma-70 factor [Bacteroidales bacterium]